MEMPGSVTSVFSETEDFEAALREEGYLGLLVTGQGAFRARLTQIALHRLRISAGEEQLARVALFAVPAEMILVALPIAGEPMPVWGGIRMRADEIINLGGDRPIHVRTEGACRWSSIWVPAAEIVCYGSAMTGNTFSIPSAAQWWRLRPATSRCLRQLHAAAVNLVESRSTALSVAETAHGLEQQLIEGTYDLVLRALPHVNAAMPEEARIAVPLLERALALEPNYGVAHGYLAWCFEVLFVRGGLDPEMAAAAVRHAHAAITHGLDDAIALGLAGFVISLVEHDRPTAIEAFESALALSPSCGIALILGSIAMGWANEAERALEWGERAVRQSPFDPLIYAAHVGLAVGHFAKDR
jgi:hypothetical protein